MDPMSLDEHLYRGLIADEIMQYAQETHRHVGVFGCLYDKGDRCDITAALKVAASRVRSRGVVS